LKTGPRFSCRSVIRRKPPKDEEVAATERAPEGQKQPAESFTQRVPVAHPSEIDRSAPWTPCEQHLKNLHQTGAPGYWE
jgi:hypothetical protein